MIRNEVYLVSIIRDGKVWKQFIRYTRHEAEATAKAHEDRFKAFNIETEVRQVYSKTKADLEPVTMHIERPAYARPVVCIDTGLVYASPMDAAKLNGIPYHSLLLAIRNGNDYNSKHYMYLTKTR